MILGDPTPSSLSSEEPFADDQKELAEEAGTETIADDQRELAEEAGTETIADAINQGNIDLAINKLENNILDTADSASGGSASNDFIKNPDDQQKLNQLVTDALL